MGYGHADGVFASNAAEIVFGRWCGLYVVDPRNQMRTVHGGTCSGRGTLSQPLVQEILSKLVQHSAKYTWLYPS